MLNVVAVMGRLVADPELRKTPNGVSTTTFTIACDRSYVKPGAERQTDFLDIVAWRSSAEFVCKYFRKGQLIAANGSLQTRTYEDKEGKKRKVYEIVADNLHFADSKGSSGGGGGGGTYAAATPARIQEEEPASYSAGAPDDFAVIDDSEDLPF
ncbi:single-stranded DNA-binding protein [Ruminococcaceae bacterium OttesenSCG-928-A16]|nr:single-stranded DNA-binding protein [Ruminococcaceae bacterium OttesenSCG-928-A16]